MTASGALRAAADLFLALGLWALSFFAVSRRASAWYERAFFRWYVKLPRSVCAIFICHDAERENRGWRKPIWVAPGEDRQKMNLLGLTSHLYFAGLCGYMLYVTIREDFLGAAYPERYSLRLFGYGWCACYVFVCLSLLNNCRVRR